MRPSRIAPQQPMTKNSTSASIRYSLTLMAAATLHRADHLQIIRADVQVQLLAAGIDDLVVAFQLRLVVVDHAFHLGVLLACTAKIHVAEALQDLLLKLPVDLAGCDLLFQRYQLQHQTVVGGLRLIARTFQLDVIQDIVRGHHLAPVSKSSFCSRSAFLYTYWSVRLHRLSRCSVVICSFCFAVSMVLARYSCSTVPSRTCGPLST